jgi:hypothetical protein
MGNRSIRVLGHIMEERKMNETTSEAINQAGNAASNGLLNFQWADGAAEWLNGVTNSKFFTSSLVGAFVPLISIMLLYWKWGTLMSFVDNMGKFVLLAVAAFLLAKGLGAI